MMGNTKSTEFDDQAEQIFTNELILRKVLGNIPAAQLQRIRSVNKMTNYVATHQLNFQGSKVRRFLCGTEVKEFLRQMDMRLEDQLPFSAFGFVIGLIPLADIQRFSVEMVYRVRKLTIDLTGFPKTEPPSSRNRLLRGLTCMACVDRGRDRVSNDSSEWVSASASQKLHSAYGIQEKLIQLLSAFSQTLEELRIIFQDETEIRWEITFDEADLGRLPTSFPRLRHFTSHQINIYPDHSYWGEWNRPIGKRFLPYIFSTAPNMELVTISCLPLTLTSDEWEVIVEELRKRPVPVSLELCLYPGYDIDEDFLRDLIRIGYNKLTSLNISIASESPETIIPLVNTFINLQRNSLETLRLCPTLFPGVILEYNQNHKLILPILPKLKRLNFLGNFNNMIRPFEAGELFPQLEEVTLCPENHPIMESWFTSNVRIIRDTGKWPDTLQV